MSRRWPYWFSLLLIIAISFIVKFAALNKYEAPPSCDYGNYLTQVNVLNGYDLRGLGLTYNPLFLVVLDGFLVFFDEMTALKVLASIIFSVIAIPFFLLAKELSDSYLAALVGSWVFLFFEGYAEMISWGGNPNFLGFSFLLLTLFFLALSFRQTTKKNILLTGFSLSLIIGVHFLVAVFAFLFFCAFAILTLAFNRKELGKSLKILLSTSLIAGLFSLPYVPVYATFIKYSSSGLVDFDVLKGINAAIAGLGWMFRSQYPIAVIMGAVGVFALATHIKSDKTSALIVCSLLTLPFILSLITDNPDRWFYFLPISIVLSFSLFLGDSFRAIREKGRRFINIRTLLTICLILFVTIGSTASALNRLDAAINYYQTIGIDELQALQWIKENTPLNTTFATSGSSKNIGGGGNSYSWWIEGYSKRKCIPSGPPNMYSYTYERNEVEVADRIFAGAYVFDRGNERASEAFPSGIGSPTIATYVNGQYQNLLFLSDGEEEITFSPVENEQVIWHEAPFYAGNKTMALQYNDTSASTSFSYEWSRLKFMRNVVLNSKQSSVDVMFHLLPANSTLKQFTVNIWGAYYTSLLSFDLRNSTIFLKQKVQTTDVVTTKIEVLATNAQLNNTQVFYADPKYSMPLATYAFTPLEDSISVHIRISIITDNATASNSEVYFYNSYELIRKLKIDYIFLDKARQMEYVRFLYDPDHYSKVFENNTIVIFKVIAEET